MIKSASSAEEGGSIISTVPDFTGLMSQGERIKLCRRLLNKSKHTQAGCREWIGPVNNSGYGQISVRGKKVSVHRIAYAQFVAPIPEGLHVMHKCDNRRCIRPSHLSVGTRSDNMQDCSKKGRLKIVFGRNRGEINGSAKLKDSDVCEIRKMLAQGVSQSRIAVNFGVSQSHVSRINTGDVRK